MDEHFAKHKKPSGPLHGLPVSLKDQFHVKGVETTMGYVGWIGTFEGKKGTGKEKVFESEMVKELRDLGAVLYCKTSVPHTLMTGETTNNIVGYVRQSPQLSSAQSEQMLTQTPTRHGTLRTGTSALAAAQAARVP